MSALACLACGNEASSSELASGCILDGPRVISTVPPHGDRSVEPGLTEIRVTYDTPMLDGNHSWMQNRPDNVLNVTGEPYFTDDGQTAVLPVSLESTKSYVLFVNSPDNTGLRNFMDTEGNVAVSYEIHFHHTLKRIERAGSSLVLSVRTGGGGRHGAVGTGRIRSSTDTCQGA